MASLADEAGLSAMALIRAAIEDKPDSSVMDVVAPYMIKTMPSLAAAYEAGAEIEIGLPYEVRQLFAVLAQMAAGSFQALQLAQSRRSGMNKAEVLARLTEFEACWRRDIEGMLPDGGG